MSHWQGGEVGCGLGVLACAGGCAGRWQGGWSSQEKAGREPQGRGVSECTSIADCRFCRLGDGAAARGSLVRRRAGYMSKERRGDSETGEGHHERPAAGAAERERGSLAAVEGRWWGRGRRRPWGRSSRRSE